MEHEGISYRLNREQTAYEADIVGDGTYRCTIEDRSERGLRHKIEQHVAKLERQRLGWCCDWCAAHTQKR